jgi:hypothetical protein
MSQSVAKTSSTEAANDGSKLALKRRNSNVSVVSRLSRISLASRVSSHISALTFGSADGEQLPGKYVVVYEPLDKKLWMDTPENVESRY